MIPPTDTTRLKRNLGMLWKHLPESGSRRIVLLYHAIGDSPWAMRQADFVRQMEWLAGKTHPLSLVQALETAPKGEAEVAITFDDGYGGVFDEALPIIRSLGMTAAVFVNSGLIGDNERKASDAEEGHYPDEHFLTWREIDALLDRGWVIGSHGDHHLDFSRQPDSVVSRELLESKMKIEKYSPGPCQYFAYTWGRHTAHLRRLVQQAGYRHALAANHSAVSLQSDPFAIPRINIDREYSLDDFKAIVRGDWDYLRFVQRWRGHSS